MPIKINVMFDNFNIQTWKKVFGNLKKITWFTEKTCKTNTKKHKKLERKKYEKNPNIYESKIKSRIFVE